MVMIASPTRSPYLSALQRAAVAHHPSKQDHPSDNDFCFVCGNTTPAAIAYCSDACRALDDRPSPLLSPTSTALPALVSSRSSKPLNRNGAAECSPPSSANSSPLKTADGEDDEEEEDIENLVLPPPVASYGKKAQFNYSYTLATSPVAARSPVKSPVQNASHSTQSGHKSPKALLATTIKSVSPPSKTTAETITFRRRHQPDSIEGTKSGAPALSPALLARRRLSNQQSTHQKVSGIGSTVLGGARIPSTSISTTKTSPKFDIDLALNPTTRFLRNSQHVSHECTTRNPSGSARCTHLGCPVTRVGNPITGFPALQRRVSEPHSPYASPRADSPSGHDVFERSFAARRPSLSATATAPPVPSSSDVRARDYTGFAGFLANLHRTKRDDAGQDGYEGQDEKYVDIAKQVQRKRNSSKDGLYMLSSRKSAKSPKVKPVEAVQRETASSSSVTSRQTKPTRSLFGRGQAFAAHPGSTAATSSEDDQQVEVNKATVAGRTRHNHSASASESSGYVVSVRPQNPTRASNDDASNIALATSSSSSDEGHASKVNSATKTSVAQPARKRSPSEVREQYRSRIEEQQERGRDSTRRTSGAGRAAVVSPFTALRDATKDAGDTEKPRKASSPGDSGRGRSRARMSVGNLQRSVSPNRSRSRASRSPRRVFTS